MAQRTVTLLTDDLTGDELEVGETVTFGLDGASYELDLSPENAAAMRDGLANYVACARRVGGRRGTRASVPAGVDNRAVRAWAASNGVELSTRGRIPASVVEQYRAAGH